MGKIIMLKGLPGSGKSTKSKEILATDPDAARVNKDDIRKMLRLCNKRHTRSDFSSSHERATKAIEKEIAKMLLDRHFNVIVDDTNLEEDDEKFWSNLAAAGNHRFEVIDLTNVEMDECIKRDAGRGYEDSVGPLAISTLAGKAGLSLTKNTSIDIPEGYIIVDIDGTLANIDHRTYFVHNPNDPNMRKDWASFFGAMLDDTVNEHVTGMLEHTWPNVKRVIVTGRPEAYRDDTVLWLTTNGIEYEALFMRESGDFKPDYLVKAEILQKYLKKEQVKFVIDDRADVVKMWRSQNLSVIDVGMGISNF